jgi:AraC-like DNA-binding protein
LGDNDLSFRAMMKTKTAVRSRQKPTVPMTYLCLLVDVVARWKISAEHLLAESPIHPDDLLKQQRLDYQVFSDLLHRGIKLTGELGLGFHLGLQLKVSCHGLIGYAVMVANTLREALDISQNFIELQASTLSLRLEEHGDQVTLYLDEVLEDYPLSITGAIFVLVGFASMGEALTGKKLTGTASVKFPKPPNFARFEHLLMGQVRFAQPTYALTFAAEYLDLPLVMADPVAARIAREQCKQELYALGGQHHFSQLVRDLVYDEAVGFFSLEDVADKLHMSTRTLQRQLAQEHLSFSDIIDERRHQVALRLLRQRRRFEEMADVLGYTDVSNFSRAFKRWTGLSPRAYMQQMDQ